LWFFWITDTPTVCFAKQNKNEKWLLDVGCVIHHIDQFHQEIISLTYLSLAVLFHYLISPDVIIEMCREDIYVMCMVIKIQKKNK